MNIVGHVVNTIDEKWYHIDDKFNLWTCNCREGENSVSLCLSQCDHLQDEGELRNLKRIIAEKRKELGLLQS